MAGDVGQLQPLAPGAGGDLTPGPGPQPVPGHPGRGLASSDALQSAVCTLAIINASNMMMSILGSEWRNSSAVFPDVAADLGDSQVPGPGAGADVRGLGEGQAVSDVDRDVGVSLQLAVVLADVLRQKPPDDEVAILADLQSRVLPDLEAAGEDDPGPALPKSDQGAEPEHGAGEAHLVPGRRKVARANRDDHGAPELISGKYEVRIKSSFTLLTLSCSSIATEFSSGTYSVLSEGF